MWIIKAAVMKLKTNNKKKAKRKQNNTKVVASKINDALVMIEKTR